MTKLETLIKEARKNQAEADALFHKWDSSKLYPEPIDVYIDWEEDYGRFTETTFPVSMQIDAGCGCCYNTEVGDIKYSCLETEKYIEDCLPKSIQNQLQSQRKEEKKQDDLKELERLKKLYE